MNRDHTQDVYQYSYSATQAKEIETIRSKYLPKRLDKMQQLRALDISVSKNATVAALTVGIVGALVMGLGMSCVMVWAGQWFLPGILLGLVGVAGVAAAYPVYKHTAERLRCRIAPQILQLSEELLRGDTEN